MGTTIAERAIFYAGKSYAVFPVCTIDGDACSCGKPIWRKPGKPDDGHRWCQSPGKHPVWSLAPHGVLDATTDAQLVREWWALYPDANIGIATGDASELIVLDVDFGHGGDQTLLNLEQRNGELPPTWAVETGGGGMHFYFHMPPTDIRNSAGAVGPGVDVRGNGGYVVAPPSRHASGRKYKWASAWHPTLIPDLAEVPSWLLRLIAPGSGSAVGSEPLPKRIAEGKRNVMLASAAGTMRRRGFCEEAIIAALIVENKRRCVPPLDANEVLRIARSIDRYSPAGTIAGGDRWIAQA